ncbi:hypothetical protein W02_03400 [Nitrospira sp. KM1]|nr:hypothetical protein W02_03400 [Nitrospira sp. KM1]
MTYEVPERKDPQSDDDNSPCDQEQYVAHELTLWIIVHGVSDHRVVTTSPMRSGGDSGQS